MRLITVTVAASPVAYTSGGTDSLKPDTIGYPLTVSAIPGAGGTLLVEYQLVKDGSWTEWPGGVVAAKTIYVLAGPVYALRFTAAVSTGTVEIAQ